MNGPILPVLHLLSALAKLIRPGGYRSVIAENLLLKQQLIIHSRSRQRSPNLSTQQRTLLGFFSLFLSPRRISRAAIIIRPSTLLRFHSALVKRKYQQLYSPRGGRKPVPSGPSKAVIQAIVEMKQHNPRYGCPRIAQQINQAFGLELDNDTVRRIIGFSVHAGTVDGPALCRMFNEAIVRQGWPCRLSTDNDPLFQYRQWKANLSILEIREIKSLPYAPMSHPFVERLIGSVRRELLDQTFFWTQTDLENKLHAYRHYYNQYRCHSSRKGLPPVEFSDRNAANLDGYRWNKHCRGLFQLPIAA